MYGRFLFFLAVLFLLFGHQPLQGTGTWFMQTVMTVADEFFLINKNFLSIDTVKIFTATVPLYLIARQGDHRIHYCFYEPVYHKNINQSPGWWYASLNTLNDIGIILYSSFSLIAPYEELRRAARIFGLGFVSAMLFKDIVKNIHTTTNIRPYNENFRPYKTYGAFPSGHMAQSAYMATVLGLEYGLKAAIPLTIGAGLLFGALINSNRHYTSQVIAGAALGCAYGLAAHKVINLRSLEMECTLTYEQRHLQMGLRYCF